MNLIVINVVIMGLSNFLKRQAGIGRLPDSQLNEITIINLFKQGVPFVVALPIWDTERSSGGSSISKSMGGGFRQTVYYRPPSRKVQRKIVTNVTYNVDQLTIQHAQKNGKHIIIKANKIAKAGLLDNGVMIEHVDGRQYQFIMNNDIKNAWKTLGFNPHFPMDVFHKMLTGYYIRQAQIKYGTNDVNEIMNRIEQQQNGVQEPVNPPKETKSKKSKSKKTRNKKEEAEDLPMKKIKEAKELLDMGAITQEEFDKIKLKYLEQF